MKKALDKPSALACVECRQRHLKCNAARPLCARCEAEGTNCNYMPSRRGFRSSARRCRGLGHEAAERHGSDPRRPLNENCSIDFMTSTNGALAAVCEPPRDECSGRRPPTEGVLMVETCHSGSSEPEPNTAGTNGMQDYLLDLFYTKFHNGHPILVPRDLYATLELPKSLQLVVQFIGSHFSTTVSSDALRAAAADALAVDNSKTAYRVQAMIIFAIGLHARNEQDQAEVVRMHAVDLALEFGLNRRDYASAHGKQIPALEESLRRTWWELLVVDTMFAAIHHDTSCRTASVELGVYLPSEDCSISYDGSPRRPLSIEQLENRLFEDDETKFSSFCFRIEAARILAKTLPLSNNADIHHDDIQAVDNALAGWAFHLPAEKAEIFSHFGELDEMLFQAHLMVYTATIRLHLPRSNLRSAVPQATGNTCARITRALAPTTTLREHVFKTTVASKGLSDLAALRAPVQEHTPFFICGAVLGAVVQLSVCAAHHSSCISQHRERVALFCGVLKSMGQVWPLARLTLKQVGVVAASVLQKSLDSATKPTDCVDRQDDPMCFDEPIDESWIRDFLGVDYQNTDQTGFDLLSPVVL